MAQEPKLPRSDEITGAAMAPEAVNKEQEDEGAQTQTLADEALGRTASFKLSDSEKVAGGIEDIDTPDLVDHMNHMVTSGQIDMGAYRGERSDDDVDDYFGEQGIDDDYPHPSS